MELSQPVEKVYLVGKVFARRLKKLGIETVGDLLTHFPFRYQDYSLVTKIALLQPGETVTIGGKILAIKNEFTKNRKKIQKAQVGDSTGIIEAVWYNQPFLVKTLSPGKFVSLSGKVNWFGKKLVMAMPEYELVTANLPQPTIHTGRLVPIYPETYGISSKWLRSRIAPLLEQCKDKLFEYLPYSILEKNQLINYKEAIYQIHFPESKEMAKKSRERLAFDELFLLLLASFKRRKEWESKTVGNKFQISKFQPQIQQFLKNLPFELTKSQRKAIGEILTDLSEAKPMNRLLEGDVGSGKTVVATVAMSVASLNGFQSAFMAPTEILAFQHFETISKLLSPWGIKIELVTGSQKPKGAVTQKYFPSADIIVGTHALIFKKLNFKKLALVVIDEQHRFGVEQRALLRQKGVSPHLLTMTATPIPRTVALTLYGDLDLSILKELPPGRMRVKTWVVPPEKRQAAYEWIKSQIKTYQTQAFVICPLIEESETLQAVKAATIEYHFLQKEVFPNFKIGLLHGRMKAKEKEVTLNQFRQGLLDILVATPVVEVGVDIPGATMMLIEGAERFGLAQLHQLRGRVGRRQKQSYCLLFSETNNPGILKRLKALETMFSGSVLAELDLKLRGPGEIYGTRQHGLPNLKVATFSDLILIEKAKISALKLLKEDANLAQFSPLKQKLEEYTIKPVSPD